MREAEQSRIIPMVVWKTQDQGWGCHLLRWKKLLDEKGVGRSRVQLGPCPSEMPARGLGCSVVSGSLRPHRLQPARLHCPWNFPGKNIGAGCHFLLQGIFPTQGSNLHLLGLLHWQCHLGSPYYYKASLKFSCICRLQFIPIFVLNLL